MGVGQRWSVWVSLQNLLLLNVKISFALQTDVGSVIAPFQEEARLLSLAFAVAQLLL